jgi:hypothetical protein
MRLRVMDSPITDRSREGDHVNSTSEGLLASIDLDAV